MNWDDLRYLLALHRNGTMSAAAKAVDATVATVSRRLDNLSESMGTMLFSKTADGWTATPAALRLVRLAEQVDTDLRAQRNSVAAAEHGEVSGEIAVSAPPFVVTGILVPHVAGLIERYPGVNIDLRNRVAAEGLGDDDIMIRIGQPLAGRLKSTRLAHLTLRMYRSTEAPAPAEGWISVGNKYGISPQTSLEPDCADQVPRLTLSLIEQQILAMRTTGLAGLIAEELAAHLPDMQRVEGSGTQGIDLWLCYHTTREKDPLVAATSAWIAECFTNISDTAQFIAPHPPHNLLTDDR